jgi:thiol-activated cytolysin
MTNANTQYIQSLVYDLNKLLAVNLQPSSQPAYDPRTQEASGDVIVTTVVPHDLARSLSENSLLSPTTGVVYPGAMVMQDQNLANGTPTPYTLARGPLKIYVDLAGLGDKAYATIASPTNVSVAAGVQNIVNYWLDNVTKEGYKPVVRAYSESQKSYSQSQIAVALGFGVQWTKYNATVNLSTESTMDQTIIYRGLRQIYYTVQIEEPTEIGDMFAGNVILNQGNMPAEHPPGYVRYVDYGRIIIVQMMTSAQTSTIEAQQALDAYTSGVTVSEETKTKYKKVTENSTFKAIVIGGGSSSGSVLAGDIESISKAIIGGLEFSKANPASPISYVVADMKSRSISEIKTTTSYNEIQRNRLYSRSITLKHSGAYVAKFIVTWKEYNPSTGKVDLVKSFDSGGKTAGYETKLYFSGDATTFDVKGINNTGLVWDKHRTKEWKVGALDGDKTIKIGGTTLNMWMEVNGQRV